MSEALREFQNKSDAEQKYNSTHEDENAPAETPEIEGAESPEPETPEQEPEQTPAEKLKPKAPGDGQKEKKELKPSKFQKARTDAEALRDAREASKRHKAEVESLKAEVAQIRTQWQEKVKAEEAAKDPTEALLAKGYKPEDAEKEAQRRENEGDIDGAVAAREVAREMRAKLESRAQAQQQQASRHLVAGTPEFNNVWMQNEANLVDIENRYGDEEDRELIKQFPDKNSEVGKALVDFFANDPLGKSCHQNNAGIYFAYNVVKNKIKIERLKNENAKLKKELGRSTSLTSLGSSAPASGGGSNGQKRFEDMTTDEMGKYLRAKARD